MATHGRSRTGADRIAERGISMDELPIGRITHYFPRINVAAVEVTEEELRLGDTIRVLGATSNFTQRVRSMEIEHVPVETARVGDLVGVRLDERARVRDWVFRIQPHSGGGP